MSDDLIERLRKAPPPCAGCGEYPGSDIGMDYEHAADEIEALRARAEAAEDRAHRLAYAIAGGEDAPGYLDSQPVEVFADNLRKEREAAEAEVGIIRTERHADAEAMAALEAERDRLREALEAAQESIATFIGVHGYPIESGAGDVLRQVSAALRNGEDRTP